MVKNILLIGRTGGGKSTLGNVLINKNDNFDEVFEESAGGASKTRSVEESTFEVDVSKDGSEKIKYRIIDTPGIDNTDNVHLSKEKVLEKIKEGIDSVKEGISQIFFLVKDGNFRGGEKEIFKLLEIILGSDIANYVTIVRTNFTNFEGEKDCEEDSKLLIREIKKVSGLFSSYKVIHVDNPPLAGHLVEENKQTRSVSRIKLLEYLQKNCQENYKLDSTRINDYIESFSESTNSLNQPEIEEEKTSTEFITWLKHCRIS